MPFSFLLAGGFDRFKEFLRFVPGQLASMDFFDVLDIVYLAAIVAAQSQIQQDELRTGEGV